MLLDIPRLIVHGDLWANNVLWKKSADRGALSAELSAIIDWQMTHIGKRILKLEITK